MGMLEYSHRNLLFKEQDRIEEVLLRIQEIGRYNWPLRGHTIEKVELKGMKALAVLAAC